MPRTKKTDEVVDTNAVVSETNDVNEETAAPVATFTTEVIIAYFRFKQNS